MNQPAPTETLCTAVRRWAAAAPRNPVFVADGFDPMDYGTLARQTDEMADALGRAGFEAGHRIGIVHAGGAANGALLLGVLSRATAVPLNPASTAEELEHHLLRRKANAVIVDTTLDTPAAAIAARLGLSVFEVTPDDSGIAGSCSLRPAELRPVSPPGPDRQKDLANVLATSGTTDRAKIVPIRHAQLVARSSTDTEYLSLGPDDRLLNMNNMFLGGGIMNFSSSIYAGSSVILLPRADAQAVIDALERLKPTWYVASFTINKAIYDTLKDRGRALETPTLRFVRTTSGAIDSAVADDLQSLIGAPVIEAYSSTESGRIAGNPRPPGRAKRGSVGVPVACELTIRDEDGNILGPGERGEVVVRGPKVFDGYEDDPDANAAAFIDDWYRTGDEGVVDEDGYLTLTGRIKDMINRGGEKISPTEVEMALCAHRAVAEAAAFAIPHPSLGEIAGAAIVSANEEHPGARDLTKFLRQRLTPFKVPAAFMFVDEIPRGPGGKILRDVLKDQFSTQTKATLDA